MPPIIAAATQQQTLKTDFQEKLLNEDSGQDVQENTTVEQGAKPSTKRYNARKRTKKNKDFATDAVSTVTDSGTDATDAGEAGLQKANNGRAASPLSDTDTIATEPLPDFQFGRALPQLPRAPFIEVPVLAHYEPRDLLNTGDDKDDSDRGLFATEVIERGTRIISERPILTLAAPGDQLHELMQAYNNLSKSHQDRLWNLRPAAPEASEQLSNLRFLTDRLAFDLQNIIFKPEAARTSEEQATLDDMLPKLENAMNVWRIAARWHANRCSMTDLPMDERSSLPSGTPITGLFIERAHIRHSCVPNCFASFDANLGRMNVHVTRNIAAGEELTLSAFADNMYYSTADDRKGELSAWGLTCSCEGCDPKHPKFKTHEEARQRAHSRVILLNDVLTRLEKEDLPEDDLNTAQAITLALLRDLKASSCESVELARWRNILVDRILPARALIVSDSEKPVAWQVITMHAVECERMGRICYGEDREEFRVLRQTREGCEAALEMVREAVAAEEARRDMEGGEGVEEG